MAIGVAGTVGPTTQDVIDHVAMVKRLLFARDIVTVLLGKMEEATVVDLLVPIDMLHASENIVQFMVVTQAGEHGILAIKYAEVELNIVTDTVQIPDQSMAEGNAQDRINSLHHATAINVLFTVVIQAGQIGIPAVNHVEAELKLGTDIVQVQSLCMADDSVKESHINIKHVTTRNAQFMVDTQAGECGVLAVNYVEVELELDIGRVQNLNLSMGAENVKGCHTKTHHAITRNVQLMADTVLGEVGPSVTSHAVEELKGDIATVQTRDPNMEERTVLDCQINISPAISTTALLMGIGHLLSHLSSGPPVMLLVVVV
ncbi:uncharacterized protein LOC134239452 [Saccostrea cucullata]|uniref:uncharacterized protein LOC134239452 n=1 Tax=Saccostrea cuccullata TaxID=36930 RepID=UPI002ED08F88